MYNKLNSKVNLENKIPDATTLININQCTTDKQTFGNKIGDMDKKVPGVSSLVSATVPNTKIDEVQRKMPYVRRLDTATVLDTKIGEVENKIRSISDLVKKTDYNATMLDNEAKYYTTSDYN